MQGLILLQSLVAPVVWSALQTTAGGYTCRRCAECGHIGYCDSSPSRHGSQHAASTGHSIGTSFEPREDWFWNYEKQEMVEGAELLPPHSHPASQLAPGPVGKVPHDWQSRLN